jgi:hypothetical protein
MITETVESVAIIAFFAAAVIYELKHRGSLLWILMLLIAGGAIVWIIML